MKIKFWVVFALSLSVFLASCTASDGNAVEESSELSNTSSVLVSEQEESSSIGSSTAEESVSDNSFIESSEEEQTSAAEPDLSDEKDWLLGELWTPYAKIIEKGIYTVKTTESKIIGGVSLPYVTLTCFNGDSVYVLEQESHDSSSEMLVTQEGAYYFNDAEKCMHLMPSWETEIKALRFFADELFLEDSGSTIVAEIAYDYERYLYSDGARLDFLFSADGILQKALIYDEAGEYEIISLSISEEINLGRFEIPEDYQIKDYRSSSLR